MVPSTVFSRLCYEQQPTSFDSCTVCFKGGRGGILADAAHFRGIQADRAACGPRPHCVPKGRLCILVTFWVVLYVEKGWKPNSL